MKDRGRENTKLAVGAIDLHLSFSMSQSDTDSFGFACQIHFDLTLRCHCANFNFLLNLILKQNKYLKLIFILH